MPQRTELGPVSYKGVTAYRRMYYWGKDGLVWGAGDIGFFGHSSPHFNNILDIQFEDGNYVYYLDKQRSPVQEPENQVQLDELMQDLLRTLASLEVAEFRFRIYGNHKNELEEIFGYFQGKLFVDDFDQRSMSEWSGDLAVAFCQRFSRKVPGETKWNKILSELEERPAANYYQELIKKLGISFMPPVKKLFTYGPYVHNVTPREDFVQQLIEIGAGDYIAMGNECLRRVLSWTQGTVTPLQASVIHAICVFIFVHRYIGTRISSDVVINDYVIPGSGQMTQYKYLILLATGGVVD